MFAGHGLKGRGRVSRGQHVFDLALGPSGDDPCDNAGEIGLRVYVVELASLDERGDRGPMLLAVRAREECALAMIALRLSPCDTSLDRCRSPFRLLLELWEHELQLSSLRLLERRHQNGTHKGHSWRFQRL